MAVKEGQVDFNSLSSEGAVWPGLFSRVGYRWLILSLGFVVVLSGFLFFLYLQSLSANDFFTDSLSELALASEPTKNLYFSQDQNYSYQVLPKPEVIPQKKIVIDVSEQMFYCYEEEELVKKFITSTGKPSTPTKIGSFKVLDKYRMAYGGTKDQSWVMPYWLGIYYAGSVENGIHALPYINGVKESSYSLGKMVSHGCIRLADGDAVWVYNWADIGTPVIVQW